MTICSKLTDNMTNQIMASHKKNKNTLCNHCSSNTRFQAPSQIDQTSTHTRLTTLCPGLPGSAGTRKAKAVWILLKQETASGSGISWAICKSAPHARQIDNHSVFYRPDALPAAQPTASKHTYARLTAPCQGLPR